MGRIIIATAVTIVVVLVVAALVFDHYVQFRKDDRQLRQFFADHGLQGVIGHYSAGNRTIRYISIGADSLPTLFFLHGSPSSLSMYESFYSDDSLKKKFRMVAADRPGYGGSGFGLPEPSIKKQADVIWPLLQSLQRRRQPLIIVAGSYGTSVACRLLMDHPQAADGVVLIAPALSPGQEKIFWFSRLIEHPLVRWAVPRMFQSANTEKLAHRAGLQEMLPLWKNIRLPVFYIQGEKDQLIYPSNADFARKQLVSVPYLQVQMLKNRPHFFIRTDRMIIRQNILDCYTFVSRQKQSATAQRR